MRPTGSQQRNGEREIDIERERDGGTERRRERNGEGLCVGKLQGSLKPLKERYKLHMFPSVLASRFLDVPGLYKGQACTEFGHAERPELWRRAPTNVLSTPGDLGSKCSQHPQDSKGNLPQDVKRKKERSKPTGVYLHTCCWQARPRDHNSKATPTPNPQMCPLPS